MEYELDDEPRGRLPLLWLIVIAALLWGGAWWLGQTKAGKPAPQGETTTKNQQ